MKKKTMLAIGMLLITIVLLVIGGLMSRFTKISHTPAKIPTILKMERRLGKSYTKTKHAPTYLLWVLPIDSILQKMPLGNIAFNTPRAMNLYDTALIHLLLGVKIEIEDLKRMIEEEGEKAGTCIRVSDRMEARLSGCNFEITAITPEIQAVTRSEATEWKWEIKPIEEGPQYLHLTLSALLTAEDESTPRVIRTFDRTIEVKVTWVQITKAFVQHNWQWLWAVVLVPLAGWFFKKRKREV